MHATAFQLDIDTMPATISRLRTHGYKSIASADVELTSLNVLIGANGAGKSNFIGVIGLLGHLLEGHLQFAIEKEGGADRILTNGLKHTQELRLDFHFGKNTYCALLAADADARLFFKEEAASFQGEGHATPYSVPLGMGHRETELLATKAPVAQIALKQMKGWRTFHFHDTSPEARVKQACDLHDNVTLHPHAENLAAVLFRLGNTDPNAYRQIVETIRLVAPFFDDFRLAPDAAKPDQIRLAWSSRGTDAYFGPNAFSDGTLRFICLTTLLLQPYLPTVVVIDEPELGLHPYAINVLAGLLTSASTRTQIIVSTQSVTLVNQFEPHDVIVVDRDDQGSTFRRPTDEEAASWLEDYTLGELWEKNILGGRPR